VKVHDVHSREIAAAPERVGELLDGLGGEGDRLWPGERWPTTPFELDGPLAVGTPSRQGQIRQVVEEYEPGRRIVLRFAPGLGLVGRSSRSLALALGWPTRSTAASNRG
jgi:hypothetical protein